MLSIHLTILLSLVPFVPAGGTTSPDNFNDMCVTSHAGEFSPFELANLDLYDSSSEQTSTLILLGWNAVDDGFCDNSVIACSNSTDADSNLLTVDSINEAFYGNNSAGTPYVLETTFVCESCPNCILDIQIQNTSAPIVHVPAQYTCGDGERTERLYYEADDHHVLYKALFGDMAAVPGCITITRYRVFEAPDCPSVTFNLGVYPASTPGAELINVQCVDNAAPGNQVQARCNASSDWVSVGSAVCECAAGFGPNDNLTACVACADGFFKSEAGNTGCEVCPTNQVNIEDRTDCMCMENYDGENCDQCAVDSFMFEGNCVECSSGSERAAEDNMNSCTCTGNLVATATNSPMITDPSIACDDCADGYYRANNEGPASPCNLCDNNFLMITGGVCTSCPANSNRTTDDPQNECLCRGSLITGAGATSTSDSSVACDNCDAGMVLVNGDCQPCPEQSTRMADSVPGVCMCLGNAVTASGSRSTSADACTACADGYRRKDSNDPCTACTTNYFMTGGVCRKCPSGSGRTATASPEGACNCQDGLFTSSDATMTSDVTVACDTVMVTFYAPTLTVSEGDSVRLSVAVTPTPSEDFSATITFTGSDVVATLDESTPNVTVELSLVEDDTTALQSPRMVTVMLATVDKALIPDNTAVFEVVDNDVVQAVFKETPYTLDEGDGSGQVCVTLSTDIAVDVTVRVTGEVSVSTSTPSAPSLGELDEELLFTAGGSREQCLPEFDVTDDTDEEGDDEQYRLSLEIVAPANNDAVTAGDAAFVFIDDDDSSGSSSSNIGIIIGVCAGGAALAVFAAIACIICLCCWKVRVKQQGFYHTYEDSQAPPTMLRYSASLRSLTSQSIVVAGEGKRAAQKENEFLV